MLRYVDTSGRLLLRTETGWRIAFTFETFSKMLGFQQIGTTTPESGGTLLGHLIADTGDAVVESFTRPGRGDRRGRNFFYRSNRHNKEGMEYWRKTGKTGLYLGLWHTHPESKPNPSHVDWRDWRHALEHDIYHGEGLLFVIVGIESTGFWFANRSLHFQLLGYQPHPN